MYMNSVSCEDEKINQTKSQQKDTFISHINAESMRLNKVTVDSLKHTKKKDYTNRHDTNEPK